MLPSEAAGVIQDACGVCAVVGHPEAANLVYLGLHALQHRGQESAGIASRHDGQLRVQKRMGLVADAFNREVLEGLPGDAAIGHVRYSTTGSSSIRNAQPVAVHVHFGPLALAHNGNITNAAELRAELERAGSIFQATTDTEVIAHLAARAGTEDPVDALIAALTRVEGAYSLVALYKDTVIAARDPHGVRPLVLGTLNG
ncbi:MAG: amidophosphoribosyltransferase, partial [Myxococcales bacterium]|nr:amidophosphoribosyltransferase [Myxococcales bacterium]